MSNISTEAWVLEADSKNKGNNSLCKKTISIPFDKSREVLVEPILGCWEGNMNHAYQGQPIDLCKHRQEENIVLGNAGVVRVLEVPTHVSHIRKDDLCLVFCAGNRDEYGYPINIYAFDQPNSFGLLAKKTKLQPHNLIPLPKDSIITPHQWAAFSLRYITAWANWKIALGSWSLQMPAQDYSKHLVASWGGGTGFAELLLAKKEGFKTAMVTANKARAAQLKRNGIIPIDRSLFSELNYDRSAYATDITYKDVYKKAEDAFIESIKSINAKGVSIFIDNIGSPVFKATLKALDRQGVVTTSGWRFGMDLYYNRAIETIARHTLVHTHYARHEDAIEAIDYAVNNSWVAEVDPQHTFDWDNISGMASLYDEGAIDSYFPLFRVNPT